MAGPQTYRRAGSEMIDLSVVDLEELAMALGDQNGYEHHWLIDPDSGQISLWTEDGGIDGEHPVDLDEVDLIGINPLPSSVWYQDMADFADGISDERARRAVRPSDPRERGLPAVQGRTPRGIPGPAARLVRLPRRPRPAPRRGMARRQRHRRRDTSPEFLSEHPEPDLP